jgi:hypothetical protein
MLLVKDLLGHLTDEIECTIESGRIRPWIVDPSPRKYVRMDASIHDSTPEAEPKLHATPAPRQIWAASNLSLVGLSGTVCGKCTMSLGNVPGFPDNSPCKLQMPWPMRPSSDSGCLDGIDSGPLNTGQLRLTNHPGTEHGLQYITVQSRCNSPQSDSASCRGALPARASSPHGPEFGQVQYLSRWPLRPRLSKDDLFKHG